MWFTLLYATFSDLSQGLVDLDAEIAKHEKKLDAARQAADKLRSTMSKPDYEASVPAPVQAANQEKVRYYSNPGVIIIQTVAACNDGGRDYDATGVNRVFLALEVMYTYIDTIPTCSYTTRILQAQCAACLVEPIRRPLVC